MFPVLVFQLSKQQNRGSDRVLEAKLTFVCLDFSVLPLDVGIAANAAVFRTPKLYNFSEGTAILSGVDKSLRNQERAYT